MRESGLSKAAKRVATQDSVGLSNVQVRKVQVDQLKIMDKDGERLLICERKPGISRRAYG